MAHGLTGTPIRGSGRVWLRNSTHIYVLHLRGNQRTQGERSRREGGKVFGQGSRAPVAITILVKNPNAAHDGCRIYYRDIGDYLSREEKLAILREAVSISGFSDWQLITPDNHHDWIEQRSDVFAQILSAWIQDAMAGKADNPIFRLYSLGLATGRDTASSTSHAMPALKTCPAHDAELSGRTFRVELNPNLPADAVVHHHTSNIKWDRESQASSGGKKPN